MRGSRELADALARVRGAHLEWCERALRIVRDYAKTHREFIDDDLWPLLPYVEEPRALGPVMLEAERIGFITNTKTYRPSERRHRTMMPVWRSGLL